MVELNRVELSDIIKALDASTFGAAFNFMAAAFSKASVENGKELREK